MLLMYHQSKMPGRLDHVRPKIRLRSNRHVKFKNNNKLNYQLLYLKSQWSISIKVRETLTIEM